MLGWLKRILFRSASSASDEDQAKRLLNQRGYYVAPKTSKWEATAQGPEVDAAIRKEWREKMETMTFPPEAHVDQVPAVGMICTYYRHPILRAAKIKEVRGEGREIAARLEYSPSDRIFTLRKDGTYREQFNRSRDAPRLVIGLHQSNYIAFKTHWKQAEIDAGPIE